MILPGERIPNTSRERRAAAGREGPRSAWLWSSLPWPCSAFRSQGTPSPTGLRTIGLVLTRARANYVLSRGDIPGKVLDPGLHCSPLARMTSTSRFPLWSLMLSWMSPRAGDASTCRPTSCPGPRPSMNSHSCPSEAKRLEEVNQLHRR